MYLWVGAPFFPHSGLTAISRSCFRNKFTFTPIFSKINWHVQNTTDSKIKSDMAERLTWGNWIAQSAISPWIYLSDALSQNYLEKGKALGMCFQTNYFNTLAGHWSIETKMIIEGEKLAFRNWGLLAIRPWIFIRKLRENILIYK